jgi:hypothetical protein
MRYYCYNEYTTDPLLDNRVETMSEEDIRITYYPYWYKRMCDKFGKEHVDNTYSFQDCIDDWVVVNGAWLVED